MCGFVVQTINCVIQKEREGVWEREGVGERKSVGEREGGSEGGGWSTM